MGAIGQRSILFFLPLLAHSQDCSAILDRAQKAFDTRQFADAAAQLQVALPQCPQSRARIQLALGQTLYLLGKDAEAEQSLQAVLAADPRHEEALYALGRVYAMQNRFP